MPIDLAAAIRWLRPRHLRGVALLQLGLALIVVLWATSEVEVPSGSLEGYAPVGLWVLVPLPAASAIALGTTSDLADLESAAARPLWRLDLVYLAAAVAATGLLPGTAYAIGGAGYTVPAAWRNLLLLTGLALLSGRLLRRPLSWVLPLVVLVPILYFGFDDRNQPLWCAVPLRPFDTATLLAAAVVFALGIAALVWSPWRWYALLRRRR